MLKNNVKKIIICIIAITMVVFVATKTFASENLPYDLNQLKTNTNATPVNENTIIQNIAEGQRPSNSNQSLGNVNTNTNKNVNTPTTTPYTGIGDYSTYIFIGIFVVSAIYAYKKVREY